MEQMNPLGTGRRRRKSGCGWMEGHVRVFRSGLGEVLLRGHGMLKGATVRAGLAGWNG